MLRHALTLALISTTALAGAQRIAIVYGNNGGAGPRAPLRYAEKDAARFAKTLQDVGHVQPEDVKVLAGRPVSELLGALDWAKTRAKRNPDTLLILYISSHADAQRGLLPGGESLAWPVLREKIAGTGAKARVTIVDACQSSGLIETAAKSAPTFTIQAEDTLTVKGDAFITSSASNEPSLEAGLYHGSVFTQHLVAGLLGAADHSGDNKVSLEEAYRYAYDRTTEGDSGQHPGYALRLSGYGEIMLSVLGDELSSVVIPPGVEALAIRDPQTKELLLLARKPLSKRLVLPPGDWLIEVTREGKARAGKLRLSPGEHVTVDEGELTALERPTAMVRLDEAPSPTCLNVTVPRKDPLLASMRTDIIARLKSVCGTADGAQIIAERSGGELVFSVTVPGSIGGLIRIHGAPSERDSLVDQVVHCVSVHRTLE